MEQGFLDGSSLQVKATGGTEVTDELVSWPSYVQGYRFYVMKKPL